ncbi:MAG: fused MFS/spermidine synthase [Planctomycetota bacterium]|nr:fused MFS/spermidine synthase [Planctomycetota bacterium]
MLLAAALAGAAGLGLEAILVSSSGLLLGYGRSGALGIGLFVAGWALGARLFGRASAGVRGLLVAAGLLTAGGSLIGPWLLFRPSLHAAGDTLAVAAGALAILVVAVPQGGLLPLLVRARDSLGGARGSVAGFWFASLAGGVAGAFLLAQELVGLAGRPIAAAVAGALALAAALLGAALARRAEPREAPPAVAAALHRGEAALLVALLTAWVVGLEWIGLRLGVLWLGGMQDALTAILAASLIALCVGSALLPLLLPRGASGVLGLLFLCAAGSAWLALAAPVLSAWEDPPRFGLALVLIGPALLPFGAAVPVVFRAAASGGGDGRELGGLLLHEAWGALAGAPLFHWVLVPTFGLGGALGWSCAFAALGCLAFVRTKPVAAGVVAILVATLGMFVGTRAEPALASAKLDNPALVIESFEEDRDFAVAVVRDGILGERTLLTDGFRAAGTGRAYRYMRVLGHLPVLLHPGPEDVCVVALGTGTTLGAVALHPEVEHIDVLELSAAVVRQAEHFRGVNRGALEDAERVTVRVGDGRRTLAGRPGAYDVITLEPLLPDSPFGVYLYTRDFYAAARGALRDGGLFCQWVPPHALEPEVFDAVVDAFTTSFPWSSLWLFGTQLILIGADERPQLVARRFPPQRSPLGRALAGLGLGDAPHVLARFVGEGDRWPAAERPLRDADPWILYRPRRTGAALLFDLPRNLARLRAVGAEPPWIEAGWTAAIDTWRGVAALRGAREAHAWNEAALRSSAGPAAPPDAPVLETELARARELLADDPELRAFEEELAFLRAVREGVSHLGGGRVDSAVVALVSAAELRPERADCHLYLAVALQRNGAATAARAAWAKAHELCPDIMETPQGKRALTLGLDQAALD